MQHHPADRGKSDNDGYRDRPGRDADVAGGLPLGFVLGDLADARLVLVRVIHRPPLPVRGAIRPAPHRQRLPYAPAVVDGRNALSNEGCGSAALPPIPASRLNASAASAAHSAAPAAVTKTSAALHFRLNRMPPTSGPMIEPTRPIPSAQPTPVALTAVG